MTDTRPPRVVGRTAPGPGSAVFLWALLLFVAFLVGMGTMLGLILLNFHFS